MIREISNSIAEIKEEFLDKCSQKVFPPALYKAAKNKTHSYMIKEYMRKNNIYIRCIIGNDKQSFMYNGKVVGELYITWGIPPMINYTIL